VTGSCGSALGVQFAAVYRERELTQEQDRQEESRVQPLESPLRVRVTGLFRPLKSCTVMYSGVHAREAALGKNEEGGRVEFEERREIR
jgi:hypothetical protein